MPITTDDSEPLSGDFVYRGDRQLRKRVYGRARVAIYWIVNIRDSHSPALHCPECSFRYTSEQS